MNVLLLSLVFGALGLAGWLGWEVKNLQAEVKRLRWDRKLREVADEAIRELSKPDEVLASQIERIRAAVAAGSMAGLIELHNEVVRRSRDCAPR